MQNQTVRMPSEVIENNRSRGRFGDLQYPSEGGTHGVYMEFTQYQYQGGSTASANRAGSIALPLPENITDSFGINVGSKELGVAGAAIADVIAGSGGNFARDLLYQAESVGREAASAVKQDGIFSVGSLASTAATYANYITKSGLSSIAPGFGDAVSSATGVAINPHATLVFDGVSLKSFSFQWKLAPTNESESQEIHNIIRIIKSKILPKYDGVDGASGSSSFSRGILTYPNMVEIYFVGLDPNKIFKFKKSMVSSLNVDYSPNGNVMLKGANGSAPGFINLSLSFTESQIWTADEFGG